MVVAVGRLADGVGAGRRHLPYVVEVEDAEPVVGVGNVEEVAIPEDAAGVDADRPVAH
jgi:hypothetical protein